MTDYIRLLLFPLNSPSKKVNKKYSYSNEFELIITHIFTRETHVKPRINDLNFVFKATKKKARII